MTEQTIHSVLKNLFQSQKIDTLLLVGLEEWSQMLLLYGLKEHIKKSNEGGFAEIRFEKRSIESLNESFLTPTFDLFSSKTLTYQVLETKTFGEKEKKVFEAFSSSSSPACIWCTETLSEPVVGAVHFSKWKPWEKEGVAKEAIALLLDRHKVPTLPPVLQFLSHIALSSPAFFPSNFEKYLHYAVEGSLGESEIEDLIGSSSTPTMWGLLESFLLRKKQAFFEELTSIEEDDKIHPLPLIRFFRTQIEKYILASEKGGTLPFKNQEKQKESLEKLSRESKRILLYELVMLDKKLKDGSFDEQSSLFPFFLSLWRRLS